MSSQPEHQFYSNSQNYPNQSDKSRNNDAPTYPMPPPPIKIPPNLNDIERGNPVNNNNWGDFSSINNKETRIKFVRKVYAILSLQLAFTFGIVSIFVFVKPVKDFTKTTAGLVLYIVSYVIFLILIITLSFLQCVQGLRKVPWNYLLLGALTLSMTYMLGMISAFHNVQAVLIAIGVTFFVVIGVTIFSIQTKYDFTNCWMLMLCLTLALCGFGICIGIAARYNYILQGVYGGLGAVLMAMFLAIDTQMIIGGKKKYTFDPEDYINAALQLYIDICYIFIYILSAVGAKK